MAPSATAQLLRAGSFSNRLTKPRKSRTKILLPSCRQIDFQRRSPRLFSFDKHPGKREIAFRHGRVGMPSCFGECDKLAGDGRAVNKLLMQIYPEQTRAVR